MPHSWHVTSIDALTLHRWSARALVYNDLSGHTHLFDEMTTVAFDQLMAGPLSEDALARRLAEVIDVPADARLEAWTHQAISYMESLGLIETKPSEGMR